MAVRKGRFVLCSPPFKAVIKVINLDQKVRIKWDRKSKTYYEELGYSFTDYSEYFDVHVRDLLKNSNYHVIVNCDKCGVEVRTPYRNYNRIVNDSGEYRCRKCRAEITSITRISRNKESKIRDFKRLVEEIGCQTDVCADDYKGCDEPLPITCKEHGLQLLSLSQLRVGCICPECGKAKKGNQFLLSGEDVAKRIYDKNGSILINPDEYVGGEERNLRIICGSCNKEFVTSYNCIRHGTGLCAACATVVNINNRRKSIKDIINDSTIDGKCCIVNPEDYIGIYTDNLIFKCAKCDNTFKKSLNNYLKSTKLCSKCIRGYSKGEERIADYLNSCDVRFIRQFRFPDCKNIKPLPFDFYIPSKNCCIEFDGYQHFHVQRGSSEDTLEHRKFLDSIKDNYCLVRGIKLIRIPYYDYKNIENILSEELFGEHKTKDIV